MKIEVPSAPADKPGSGSESEKIDIQKSLEDAGNYKGYIFRVTPEEFEKILDGTELINILGERLIKGKDNFNNDTREGYLACGFPQEKIPNWLAQDDSRRYATTLQSIERIGQMQLESPKLSDHLWVNGKPLPIFDQEYVHLFFFSEGDVKRRTSIALNGQRYDLKPSTRYAGFIEIVGLTHVAALFAVRAHNRSARSASCA